MLRDGILMFRSVGGVVLNPEAVEFEYVKHLDFLSHPKLTVFKRPSVDAAHATALHAPAAIARGPSGHTHVSSVGNP